MLSVDWLKTTPPPSIRSVKHALAIWPKTQTDSKVYCFKQELSCHTDSASQWRVCWVYIICGEHWTGMFGGSSPETRVKRGMYVFSFNTIADCSLLDPFKDLQFQQESISVNGVICAQSFLKPVSRETDTKMRSFTVYSYNLIWFYFSPILI